MRDLEAGVYALALLAVGGIVTVLRCRRRGEIEVLLPLFLMSFAVRVFVILLNEKLVILEPKLADDWSVEVYRKVHSRGWESVTERTFILQTLINFPAFSVFGAARPLHVLTNAFFGSFVGVAAFHYLSGVSRAAAWWSLILLSFHPTAVNFSLFGLRDIIIYFFIVVNVVVSARAWVHGLRRGDVGAWAVSLGGVAALRPELTPLVLVLPVGLLHCMWWGRLRRRGTPGGAGLYVYVIGVLLLVGAGAAYWLWLWNIAVKTLVSPVTVLEVYAEQRFDRLVGEQFGAGTHVLPPGVYRTTPWYLRWAIQTVGMVVVPMPWLLTGPLRFLAFADSLLLIGCLVAVVKSLKRRRLASPLRIMNAVMIATFFVSIAAMGFIINNGGNAFRMRLALLPYVLVPLAVYLGSRRAARPLAVGRAITA